MGRTEPRLERFRSLGRIRSAAVAAAVLVVALCGAAAARADQHHFTAAGQAAAKKAVLKKSDLPAGWKGGAVKPDLSDSTGCAGYHPKDSDLVDTGAAETRYTNTGVQLDTQATILETRAMVHDDFERAVVPAALTCLKQLLAKKAGSAEKVVSAKRVAPPKAGADESATFRIVIDVSAKGQTVGVLTDIILIGKGRTEVTLMVTAPLAAQAPIATFEARVSKLLVSRAAS